MSTKQLINVLTNSLHAGNDELREGWIHLLGLKEHPRLAPIGDVVSKSDGPVISWSQKQVILSRGCVVRS